MIDFSGGMIVTNGTITIGFLLRFRHNDPRKLDTRCPNLKCGIAVLFVGGDLYGPCWVFFAQHEA
jgi:hypothetical protein